MKTRKLLSLLLTLAMVLGLFAAMPMTASAATHTWNNGTAPTLTASSQSVEIQSGATGTLTVPAGYTVTIESSGAVTNNNAITIALGDASSKVIWQAEYTGTVAGGSLITVTGTGTFEVADGSITQNGDNNAIKSTVNGTITVSGGTVSSAATSGSLGAINTIGTVIISAGLVENTGSSFAVYSSNVTVNDGTVKAGAGWGIYYNAGGGIITVNGGTVEATSGLAINANNAGTTVDIQGGTVRATTGTAIKSSGTVNLSGGTVSAGAGTAIEAGTVNVNPGSLVIVKNTNVVNPAIMLTGATGSLFASGASASITVTGNINSTSSDGVYAENGAVVDVTGDVTASNMRAGVIVESGARVSVCNITAGFGVLAADNGSTVSVTGDISADVSGVFSEKTATVTVTGHVTATTGDGIYTETGGKVYFIPGTITAGGDDIKIGTTHYTLGAPTTANGLQQGGYYWDVYTDTTSYVYIRKGAIPVPPGGGGGGGWIPSAPTTTKVPEAPKPAFPASGKVVGNRITVYKNEKLKTTLFRLNKGDAFTVLGLANGGRALYIEQGGRKGYVALKDIGIMFGTAIRVTAQKKATVYTMQANGKLKRTGCFPKEQTLWIHDISGKYLINQQLNVTYYLDAAQWKLWLPK